jgi:hypothetical protein
MQAVWAQNFAPLQGLRVSRRRSNPKQHTWTGIEDTNVAVL